MPSVALRSTASTAWTVCDPSAPPAVLAATLGEQSTPRPPGAHCCDGAQAHGDDLARGRSAVRAGVVIAGLVVELGDTTSVGPMCAVVVTAAGLLAELGDTTRGGLMCAGVAGAGLLVGPICAGVANAGLPGVCCRGELGERTACSGERGTEPGDPIRVANESRERLAQRGDRGTVRVGVANSVVVGVSCSASALLRVGASSSKSAVCFLNVCAIPRGGLLWGQRCSSCAGVIGVLLGLSAKQLALSF